MRLLYHPWNFNQEQARTIAEAIRDILPLPQIFDEIALKKDVILPSKKSEMYDVWEIAESNAVDLSKDRLAILTTEKIRDDSSYDDDTWSVLKHFIKERTNGVSYWEPGVMFIRPIRHDQEHLQKVNIPYGIELLCHELTGQFILHEHGSCEEPTCYANCQPIIKDNMETPCYGRDHYCERHSEIMLSTATKFRLKELPIKYS